MPFHIFTSIMRYCVYLALMLSEGDAVKILYFCKFWKDYHIFLHLLMKVSVEWVAELKTRWSNEERSCLRALDMPKEEVPLMAPLEQSRKGLSRLHLWVHFYTSALKWIINVQHYVSAWLVSALIEASGGYLDRGCFTQHRGYKKGFSWTSSVPRLLTAAGFSMRCAPCGQVTLCVCHLMSHTGFVFRGRSSLAWWTLDQLPPLPGISGVMYLSHWNSV